MFSRVPTLDKAPSRPRKRCSRQSRFLVFTKSLVGNTFCKQQPKQRERSRKSKQRPSLPVEAKGRTRHGVAAAADQRRNGDNTSLLAVCGSQVASSLQKEQPLGGLAAAAGNDFKFPATLRCPLRNLIPVRVVTNRHMHSVLTVQTLSTRSCSAVVL